MPVQLTCPYCGVTQRMRSDAKHCGSHKCKKKAYRERKKNETP